MKKILSFLTIILSFLTAYSTEIQKETTYINGTSGRLFTILEYPAEVSHDVKYPLVILCHGFSGNCQTPLMNELAKEITAEGIAVLRFDFNGHGKSEGEFKDMTIPNEVEDLECVIAWARSQPWVESVSLLGHSQGGVVVSMVAGQLGDNAIKSEVLMAPAAVLRDDALRGNTMGATYNPWNLTTETVKLPRSPEGGQLLLGKQYILTALSLPIYETARKYNGPALIIHGTHDTIVPYTYGERYRDELPNSELQLIDGDNHGFGKTMAQTCRSVAKWFKEQLKPAPVNPVRI